MCFNVTIYMEDKMKKQNMDLTEREIHVTRETLQGKSNKQIAASLFITQHTVKAHLKSIFSKTGTKRRVELISKLFAVILEKDLSTEQLINAINTLIQDKK